jgi:protein ImuB
MRLAALRVPDFPLQALRRSYPELGEAPLAVAAGPSPRDAVVAIAAEAAELGVKPGMTAAQARQVAPAVLLRVTHAEVAAAADEALADVAGGLSPHIKRSCLGEVVLDVSGLRLRWGGEDAVANELLRRCHRVSLAAQVGIAGSVGVAVVASRCGDAVVVPASSERTFLAPLPLALLAPAPELAAALWRWGIASVGALAALPRAEVMLRLGEAGVALHRLASGEEGASFIPDPARELLREGVVLEHPIGALEPFLFTLHGLLSRLGGRLELRGAGFAELLLELQLEGGGSREYRIALTAPTREEGAVLAMARLQLEATPPGAAVEEIVAQATPGRVRLVQGSLFTPPLPAPGKLAATMARLGALVGPDRVGAPSIPDTHRPAVAALAPFAPAEGRGPWPVARGPKKHRDLWPVTRDPENLSGHPGREGVTTHDPQLMVRASRSAGDGGERATVSSDRATGHGPRATVLRAFRPARPAQVTLASGRPVVVLTEGCGGLVVGWAGPYRFVGEWWQDRPFARDDYDVATSDGAVLRLYYDRLERRWLVDGVYD